MNIHTLYFVQKTFFSSGGVQVYWCLGSLSLSRSTLYPSSQWSSELRFACSRTSLSQQLPRSWKGSGEDMLDKGSVRTLDTQDSLAQITKGGSQKRHLIRGNRQLASGGFMFKTLVMRPCGMRRRHKQHRITFSFPHPVFVPTPRGTGSAYQRPWCAL